MNISPLRGSKSGLLYSHLVCTIYIVMKDSAFQPLLCLLDRLSDELVELRDGVRKAIRIADHDPEMGLTRVRKVLEYIVRDVYTRRCNEQPGTRQLENLLQRLSHDEHVPRRIWAYANSIRELGNVGTHTFGEGVSIDDVRQSLSQLLPVVKWYIEVERPDAVISNNWQRDSKSGTGVESSKRRSSPRNEMYRRYFNALSNELRDKGEKASIGRSWSNFPSGARGIAYNTDFARGDRVRAELYIVNNKNAFNALLAQREVIERELGEPLEWYSPDNVIASRITSYHEGSIEDSEERLAEVRAWTVERLLNLKRIFGPRLAELSRRPGY